MVIIAEEQTGGVGRLGRAWVSPAGGIWITIVLKPKIPIDRLFMITMAGSIAIARAIRKEYGLSALIKWPNDIFIGDKKVGGLLLGSPKADAVHTQSPRDRDRRKHLAHDLPPTTGIR